MESGEEHGLVYFRADEDVPIRQGDILGWHNDRYDFVEKLGVVLTADCDIAQKKITDFYAVLPIRPLSFYINSHWLDLRIRKLTSQICLDVVDLVRAQRRENGDGPAAPDISVVEDWLHRSISEAFIARLNLSKSRAAAVRKNGQSAQELFRIQENLLGPNAFSNYVSVIAKHRNLGLEAAAERVRGDLKGFLSDLPQDVFLLNSLPAGNESPYIVLLRYVDVAPLEHVATGLANAKDLGRKIVRICRLSDRFRFAMSQQFSNLYSRIGIPEFYEEERRDLIEITCDAALRLSKEE